MTLELYTLPGCPYCRKVERRLDELDVEYVEHEVPSAHAERTEVQAISGQPRVPVIVDEEHGVSGMNESDDIVAYLEETYGNGATA